MDVIRHDHEFTQVVALTIEKPQCAFDNGLMFRRGQLALPISLV